MNQAPQTNPLSSIFTDGLFRFLALIVLFISLLLKQKNLVFISLLLLIVFYTSKLWSILSTKNVDYSFDGEKRMGFPGEQVNLKASVSNQKLLPVWFKLKIPVDQNLSYQNNLTEVIIEEFNLLWFEKVNRQWIFIAKKRGCYQIGPPFLETGDLLGFFQKKIEFNQSVEIIIYPKTISLNHLSLPFKELFGQPGVSSPIKDPVYPLSIQDYSYRDPAKYIHWKASAHYNSIQSKTFESSFQKKTLILLDVGSYKKNRHEEPFEKTLEVIASLILEFTKKGHPYGVFSNGSIVGNKQLDLSFANTPEHLFINMEILARIEMNERNPIMNLLLENNKIPTGTSCLYFSYNFYSYSSIVIELLKKQNIECKCILAEEIKNDHSSLTPIYLLNEIYDIQSNEATLE